MQYTRVFGCKLSWQKADRLNRESGRIYTLMKNLHYEVYEETGEWLRQGEGEKLCDEADREQPKLLYAHSVDAAQQGFYKGCKTAKSLRCGGNEEVKYPHWDKRYRTTVWKNTGIQKLAGGRLRLALARGIEPVIVELPEQLAGHPGEAYREMRLVYDKSGRRYQWHLVIEDGCEAEPAPGDNVMALDMGEIHPVAAADEEEGTVITCRDLRAAKQYRNKRIASIEAKQSGYVKGSRRWRRLQRRKNKVKAKQQNCCRDMEHKVSREAVEYAKERKVGTLVIGDVRDVGDSKRLNRKSQQKVSQWAHGRMRRYITYKAEAAGIVVVDDVSEAYTSQTCPACGHRSKPRGRVYHCPACGFDAHRDVVGACNILSRYCYGELGRVRPPARTKYRRPFNRRRSPLDTGQVARLAREAARF
jgi:putative transposase